MFRIQSPFMILIFLSVGLSACTTATPISTATSQIIPTTTSTSPAITATETLAPTPEPTATPEPVVVQKEVTFDLKNRETVTMPAFLLNNPSNDKDTLMSQQDEVMKKVLNHIVNEGDVKYNVFTLSRDAIDGDNYFNRLFSIELWGNNIDGSMGIRTGLPIYPPESKDYFRIMIYSVGNDTGIVFEDNAKLLHSLFIGGIDASTILDGLQNGRFSIWGEPEILTP